MSETLGLKNINMLSKEQYDGVESPSNDEIWAVEVETYHDDAGNWYRVYPDGWCEQGGLMNTGITSVNFFKEFKDTKYNIAINYINSTATGNVAVNVLSPVKTTTGFTISTSSYERNWCARGYIKQ